MSNHNHHKNETIIILFLLLFLTFGCSVIEQRSFCPCWVGLDFSSVLAQDRHLFGDSKTIDVTIYDSCDNVAYSHSYGLDSCCSHYEIELSRGQYTVSAVIGSTQIGSDSQADDLYGKSLPLDAADETAEAAIEPLKQFASMDIRILSSPCDSINVSLKGSSAAIDRMTLEALNRQYSCERTSIDGKVGFNMLRQAEGELLLSFSDACSGKHITDIDLGRWLKETGYDFSAESLSDIVLILDFYNGTAKLFISGWMDAPAYFIIF